MTFFSFVFSLVFFFYFLFLNLLLFINFFFSRHQMCHISSLLTSTRFQKLHKCFISVSETQVFQNKNFVGFKEYLKGLLSTGCLFLEGGGAILEAFCQLALSRRNVFLNTGSTFLIFEIR